MFVSPEHRGSGIATRLLGQLAAWFVGQGASRVCVNVETENQRARAFYRRHGARDFNAHWLEWLNIDVARV
jgi:predicted GNAT family acetyltransferase